VRPLNGSADGEARTPATLIDVARLADVHASTASRALNVHTRGKVSTATVARVLDAAKRLGYQPNSLARGLKMSRTFTVGMLIPDLTNPLFPPIVRGIEDRLSQDGWTLVIANTDNDDDKERSLLDAMTARRVDGLILATARRRYPLLDEILASAVPVVLVNRVTDNPTVPSVLADDHAGIGMAVRHLASLGHRRIAHVGGTRSVSTGLTRYQSFISWLQSEGLEVDDRRIVLATWFNEDRGAAAAEELLSRDVDFTAAVCGNDLIALGLYDVLRARNLRIPEDISVIGYNDIPFNDKFSPPLTSIRLPHYDIGWKAAELLLEVIGDPERSPVAVRLRPELVVRGSTAPPR
jgi:LacI family transcriptional regulator, galactose operon repressor